MLRPSRCRFSKSALSSWNDERGLIGWIVIGLIAGWLAGKIARGAGYGCITDIILGLVGCVLGGWIFTKLGILGRRIPLSASPPPPSAPSSWSRSSTCSSAALLWARLLR